MLAIPEFTGLEAALGAALATYPDPTAIPQQFFRSHRLCDVANKLFFDGGKLADHGLQFKPEIDQRKAMAALRAWLSSFAPSHEHKVATVAWALSEWTEGTPTKQASASKGKRKPKKKKRIERLY